MNSLKKKSKNYKYKIKHHNKQKGGDILTDITDYPGFEQKIENFVCCICHEENEPTYPNGSNGPNGPLIKTCKSHVVHLTCMFKICPYIQNKTLKYKYITETTICPLCRISDDYTFAESLHTVKQGNIHYLHTTGHYDSFTIGGRTGNMTLSKTNNKVIFMTEEICDNIILQFENIKKLLEQYIEAIPDNITTEENPNIDLNHIKSIITDIYNIHTTSTLKLSVNSLTITKSPDDSLFNFYFIKDIYNNFINTYVCNILQDIPSSPSIRP